MEIEQDLETDNLYVMTDDKKIIGAISIVPENEMDELDCWENNNSKEIARVVVDKLYQGNSISLEMVNYIEEVIRERGYKSIHLSVAKTNIPAYKTYVKAGFTIMGDADMYGNSYFLMEKNID